MPWFVTWNVCETENFERKGDYTEFIFCDYGYILSLSFVMNIISRVLFYLVLFLMQ